MVKLTILIRGDDDMLTKYTPKNWINLNDYNKSTRTREPFGSECPCLHLFLLVEHAYSVGGCHLPQYWFSLKWSSSNRCSAFVPCVIRLKRLDPPWSIVCSWNLVFMIRSLTFLLSVKIMSIVSCTDLLNRFSCKFEVCLGRKYKKIKKWAENKYILSPFCLQSERTDKALFS